MSFKNLLVVMLLLLTTNLFSQKGVTTFGLQYKPIIPNRMIGTYTQDFNEGQLVSSIKQKLGHCYGGVVRHGLNNMISLETGINFTQRFFGLNFEVADSGLASTGKVGIVSYEIPLSCLIYIRLGEQFYMNTSLGTALTLFTSNVRTVYPLGEGELFTQEGAYNSKMQGALLANLGFEYRTRGKGYFYVGTSFHQPFTYIMRMAMAYEFQGGKTVAIDKVQGSYLTLDFRYFFPEKAEKSATAN
ncbi:MAG: hypothetical protein IPM74_12165 [Crocinitomicaceae bacterium]|nr:hypothetical protein [Crocinitomicaceae bacterium]MBK8926629.1 hypothetical protein [Crocinitomicaceae bacterium]